MGQIDVLDLVAAADVVDLAGLALVDQQVDAAAVVLDVQPVALVLAVAVERHRDVVDQVGDEERDDLLGKLVRTVVVRRARHHDRHLVSRPVAVGEAVRARLARRIGIARPQLVGLGARAFRHAAVDLVGRDLDEPAQRRVLARRLEQHERAVDVGGDELARVPDRAIDVGLGGEVHDDVGVLDERRRDRRIGDVPLHEAVARVVLHALEILEPAGVGQLVERRDLPVGMRRERVADEVGADEAGAAGNQDLDATHHAFSLLTTGCRPRNCRRA